MGCLPSYSWLLFLDSASSIPVAASSKLPRVTTIPLEQASAICYRTLCPDLTLPLDSLHDSQLKHVTAWWVPDCALHCLRMLARHWSQFPELISIQGMNATGSFTPAKQSSSQVVLVVKNPPANAGDLRDAGSIPGSGRSPGEGNGNRL